MEESHSMDYVDNSLGNNNGRVRTSHKIIIDDSRIMNDIDNDIDINVGLASPLPLSVDPPNELDKIRKIMEYKQ